MKINTKEVLKTFKGDTIKVDGTDLTLGEAISEVLGTVSEAGSMKLFILAQKFATEEIVDIDASDLALVKKTVDSSRRYIALIKGQILVLLEEI